MPRFKVTREDVVTVVVSVIVSVLTALYVAPWLGLEM